MRTWFVLGFVAVLGLVAGCATMTRTPQENMANVRSIMEVDALEMADDWNMIWLTDRQCRLSRWHVRYGLRWFSARGGNTRAARRLPGAVSRRGTTMLGRS